MLVTWVNGTLPVKKRLSTVRDQVKPVPSKKPKGYCIKLKGPHIYPVGYVDPLFLNPRWKIVVVKRRCMGCSKKDDWWIEV